MSGLIDITNKRFGRLVAKRLLPGKRGDGARWACECDCGKTVNVLSRWMREDYVKSCGCLRYTRDGLSNSYTGKSWQSMKTRCYNPRVASFKAYGGSGIRVCGFLYAKPGNLIAIIGVRPQGTSLDRMDGDANYSCGECPDCLAHGFKLNVRWATRLQQNRNQRDLHYITITGVTRCISEWAESAGLKRTTLTTRINLGWKTADLFKPVCT